MRVSFKASIKQLKSRGKKWTVKYRRLKGQLKDRNEKIAKLTAELAEQRKITESAKVLNHIYPAQMIALVFFIVVHVGGVLCCATTVTAFFAKMIVWGLAKSVDKHFKLIGYHFKSH